MTKVWQWFKYQLNTALVQVFWLWNRLMIPLQRWVTGFQCLDGNNVCRVLKLRIWFTNTAVVAPSYFDFISIYAQSITVEELMGKNIALHCLSMDTKSAHFVEFKDGDDPYDVRKYPLLQFSQKAHSKYLYIMPLDEFFTYCDSQDVASRRVVWLNHSVRCGSTLWCQIFHSLPEWRVISESIFATHTLLYERYTEDLLVYSKSKEFAKLVIAGYKFHVSRCGEEQSVVFKIGNLDGYVLRHVHQYFTNITVLHAYRNVLPSAKSWCNISPQSAEVQYRYERMLDTDHRDEYLLREILSGYTQCLPKYVIAVEKFRPESFFEWYLLLWCSFSDAIYESREDGIDVKYLKYESLIENKETYIRKLFDFLSINQEWVTVALQATETDSQAGMFLGREARRKNRRWERTDEAVRRANAILAEMGYPDVDTDFTFENTL